MNAQRIADLLRSTNRLTIFTETLRAASAGLGVFLTVGLACIVVDAVLALEPWGLVVLDLCLLALVAMATGYAIQQVYRNLFDARRVARQIEQRIGIEDNRLINAIDLSEADKPSVSRTLLEQSVQQGEQLADGISATDAINARPMFKALAAAGAVVAMLLIVWVSAPRVFARVLPRFFDPTGEHPPYTLVNFEVSVAPDTIYHGRPATITARLTGPDLPDQADVVFLGSEPRQRLPMLRASDGSFVFKIDRAAETRTFFVDTPKGRSDRHTLPVLEVPFFEAASVEYRYPSYTDWAASGHPLDARGIRALHGTEVYITAKSNLPLRNGVIELVRQVSAPVDNGDQGLPDPDNAAVVPVQITLQPVANDPTRVAGSFTLSFTGRYEFSLIAANGAPSEENLEGTLTAVADKGPQVEIAEPGPHVVAVENWKVPIVVQAADDVGIDRIVLLCSVNGWATRPIPLAIERPQINAARADYLFDLAALGARDGDIITYYATAWDNHPVGQMADSSLHVIQVISEQEYLEFARSEYRMEEITAEVEAFREQLEGLKKKRDQMLEELDGLRKKTNAGEELSAAEQKRMEELEAQLEKFAQETEKLAKEMQERAEQPQLYEFEKPYQDMLQKLSKELKLQSANANQAAQKSQQLRKQPGNAGSQKEFDEAAEQFKKENEPFDEQTERDLDNIDQDLDKIQKADNLLAEAENLQDIIERQRNLADRMAQFRNQEQLTPENQQRAARMAKEQELLRQELEEAVKNLEQAAKEAEKDLPKTSADAMKLCKAVGEMQVGEDQGDAAKAARAGAGKQGFEKADSAAEKLESLLSGMCKAEGAGQEMDLDSGLKLSKQGAKQSLKQLAQGRQIPGMKGNKTGQSGQGQQGSQARMTVMGPHLPSGKESKVQKGRMAGMNGPGGFGEGGANDVARGAESINPEARNGSRNSAGYMRGVPVPYREQAEAYFKRLAEEN